MSSMADAYYPPQIPDGVYYGQNARLDTLNEAMYKRNVPDVPLRPNLDSRSVGTHFVRFPVLQEHRAATVPFKTYPEYSPHETFAPLQSSGPSDYFRAHIDRESILRNQFFALQHGGNQAVYVPNSTSDLYRVTVPVAAQSGQPHAPQPFPALFQHAVWSTPMQTTTNPYIDQSPLIGKDMFNNCTQTQLRGSSM